MYEVLIFMGSFVPSFGFMYILAVVSYVSNWVETLLLGPITTKAMVKFVKEYIFGRCGTERPFQ